MPAMRANPGSTPLGGLITLDPIGVVRSPFHERVDAPRQPSAAPDVEGTVELFPGRGLEDAVQDLDSWDHLWLVVWFDRNEDGYRPKVQPPRSAVKRGVLATRAPYRPNPIGLSAVRLLRVEGLTLHIRGLDLLDGTPVLDIKPYVAYTDAIPDASRGWLDAPDDPKPAYDVQYALEAVQQLDYLCAVHGIDLKPRIDAALALGPAPHAYRRIRPRGAHLELAVKEWRAIFCVIERRMQVMRIESGYKRKETAQEPAPEAHRAFRALYR
jgi:tRNA (adenine37-N6)-methyltransferase